MHTIPSSSVEFILIGPDKGQDRVLVRSSNASIELIGFAASLGLGEHGSVYPEYKYEVYDDDMHSDDMHSVSTAPIDPSPTESDRRKSSYRFCWAGRCNSRQRRRIEEKFNMHISEIQRALDNSDTTDLEWALAPIAYASASADKSQSHRRRDDIAIHIALIMGAMGAIALMIDIFRTIWELIH